MLEEPSAQTGISRRDVLKGAVAASALPLLAESASAGGDSPAGNPVQIENQNPGAADWQLTRVRWLPDGVRSPWIEGYCSRQSLSAGESLDIFVSANPGCEFTLEIFRMGYYGGRGARLMRTFGPLHAVTQPDPPIGKHRLRECRWQPTVSFQIPRDWISGVYLGRLSRLPHDATFDPWQSYVVFIVKDNRKADILFQCSDNTWQAYNRWPDTFSLYDNGDSDWFSGPDVHISFDRPYGKYRQIYDNPQSVGSGEFLCWEFPLCYWLEQHGYDVSYCSNSDLLTPDRGLNSRCFISVGHDEYWDERQYHSVKKMIDEGVDALFLSGNTLCWVAPLSSSTSGAPHRLLTRAAPYAGYAKPEVPEFKLFDRTGPDEGLVMGVRNIVPVNGGGDWICAKPDHWLFENTGMKAGDRIPGLVGWEFHGNPAEIPGLEVVAEGIALSGGVTPQKWTSTVHPGPKGNFVFNASTIFWSQALSSPPGHMLPWSHFTRPHGPDDRVQQIMKNLLSRAMSPLPPGRG